LDVEKTPVGLKADLPQRGQVLEQFADSEVTGVVDGCFGTKGTTFLVILLDAGVLVIDMQRGEHAIRNHSGSKFAGRTSANASIKDQLHLAGPAEVEVFADHFFKEHPAGYGPVQHLCQRELRLQDRDLVAVTGLSIAGAVRVW